MCSYCAELSASYSAVQVRAPVLLTRWLVRACLALDLQFLETAVGRWGCICSSTATLPVQPENSPGAGCHPPSGDSDATSGAWLCHRQTTLAVDTGRHSKRPQGIKSIVLLSTIQLCQGLSSPLVKLSSFSNKQDLHHACLCLGIAPEASALPLVGSETRPRILLGAKEEAIKQLTCGKCCTRTSAKREVWRALGLFGI
ncbi:hypothetical protein GGI42DRAFT_24759 [Trichoderma sp. SZMC 28013]